MKIYLHNVMLHRGDEAVQAQWFCIWDGYVAYALTFVILMQQIIHVLREPRTIEDQLLQLISAKKIYGQYNHGTKKMGGAPINQFFNDPKAFLTGLIEHGYIVPGDPDGSRFFKLLEFKGAMFRVFTEAEIKLWRDWVQDEAPSFKQRDRQRPKSLEERRVDEACRTKFKFVAQIAGERFGSLRQTASPRRVFLWLDGIDKAHRAGNGSANGASPHKELDQARAVITKYDTWLAWAMVRSVYHTMTPLRVTDRQSGQDNLVRARLDIRDASDFSRPSGAFCTFPRRSSIVERMAKCCPSWRPVRSVNYSTQFPRAAMATPFARCCRPGSDNACHCRTSPTRTQKRCGWKRPSRRRSFIQQVSLSDMVQFIRTGTWWFSRSRHSDQLTYFARKDGEQDEVQWIGVQLPGGIEKLAASIRLRNPDQTPTEQSLPACHRRERMVA
ncbi:hypothetical protein ABIB80_004967 [Bradyrhizobium sp. i1.15.2]|uniref:hypothetical protein n=1 Tax=Bradyrhizobium sp. i1.15.2 TaxID=3156362 RepID=UPI00339ACF56